MGFHDEGDVLVVQAPALAVGAVGDEVVVQQLGQRDGDLQIRSAGRRAELRRLDRLDIEHSWRDPAVPAAEEHLGVHAFNPPTRPKASSVPPRPVHQMPLTNPVSPTGRRLRASGNRFRLTRAATGCARAVRMVVVKPADAAAERGDVSAQVRGEAECIRRDLARVLPQAGLRRTDCSRLPVGKGPVRWRGPPLVRRRRRPLRCARSGVCLRYRRSSAGSRGLF